MAVIAHNDSAIGKGRPGIVDALSNIDELSNEWLEAVLGVSVSQFRTVQIIDEGYASRLYRLYASTSKGDQSYILKLASDNSKQTELLETSVLTREVYFYQNLAEHVLNILPNIYCSAVNNERRQLTLLMEDLGEIPHKTFQASFADSERAVLEIAKVHATFWNAELLQRPELKPIDSQLDVAQLQELVDENLLIEANADYAFPYLTQCMGLLQKVAPWMAAETDQFRGPITLTHGDFHARNIHFMGDRTAIFDWQQAERGRPVRDLLYWIVFCTDVKTFHSDRESLTEVYWNKLLEMGVTGYKRRSFNQDLIEISFQIIPRVYCFQSLVEWSEEDRKELLHILMKADLLAKRNHYLAFLRVARWVAPVLITVMRWLGLR